ncbi:MAG: right-handed parallel beta-helix repeat-containing protein [Deltaproteobacteria bacterium]|nr:right-handed parallel beta-helix repeat-containing protein [Deltaproteobacteria bacterium]
MERLVARLARSCAALALAYAVSAVPPAGAAADGSAPDHVVDVFTPGADDAERALRGSYSGFGGAATGGEGRARFTVTSLADSGLGSLRSALEAAGRLGGGRIDFAVGGDIVLLAELSVPGDSTIDGLTAPAPGITLWGDRLGPGGGVLEIHQGNVVVRGLRIRNAVNDGIQIAAKRGAAFGRIVVDHCSVTNSGDGGIDVTGGDGALVTDVTLSWNYLAANGGPCAKTWCGGGALVKYGVTRLAAHGNVWDKNLRRNPSIDGAAVDGGALADVRGNVVRGYVENGTQLRGGARGNVVGNFFGGARPLLTAGASVFVAANEGADAASAAAPFDVASPLGVVTADAVLSAAGAPPFDAIDTAYRDALATYEDAKNARVVPSPERAALGLDDGAASAGNAPLDAATLARARRLLRSARAARTRGDAARAGADYGAAAALLGEPRGLYARAGHRVAAEAALGASAVAADARAAEAHARAALAHARRAGDARIERRAARRLAAVAAILTRTARSN